MCSIKLNNSKYFTYTYITDKPDTVKSATLTYTAGNKTETLTDDVYPYEFIVEVESPCLLTCLASAVKPRYMSVKGIVEAWDKEVEIWTEEKIDVNEEKLGLKGSPTKVKKAGAKEMKAAGQVHDGLSPEEAADLIIAKLKEKYII